MTTVTIKGPGVRQAYREILRCIRQQGLVPDSRVPSHEELVDSLGLCSATIGRAMKLLVAEGVLHRGPLGTILRDPDRASQAVWTIALASPEHHLGGFHSTLKELVRHDLVRNGFLDQTFLAAPLETAKLRKMENFLGLGEAVRARTVDAIVSFYTPSITDAAVPAMVVGGSLVDGPGVFLDAEAFAHDAFAELTRRGSRSIALVCGPEKETREPVWRGFVSAAGLADNGQADGRVLGDARNIEGGRAAAGRLLDRPPADRPDGLIVSEDYAAVGLCERLRMAEGYRPAIAVMTNKQLPLSYMLPVLCYENDLELVAAETVRMVRDRVLDPSVRGCVRTVAPALHAERAPQHV